MAWQDSYRPGSFRGAAFVTVDHAHEFGRRGEQHEFPERDQPWFEDLGRKAEGWQIQAFIIGPDYMAGRDALLAALKQLGPGTLVHPFLGTFQAQFVDGRLVESTEQGGMARFDLTFAEPGIAVTALASDDTQAASADAADATDAAATSRFSSDFVGSGQAPFVDDAASKVLGSLATSTSGAGMLLGGAGPTLRTFQFGLAVLDDAGALLGAPVNLAAAMIGMLHALGQLGARPVVQVRALRQVISAAAAMPPVAATTPSRQREAINQQALVDLVITAAAGAAVRSTANATFASYDDAVALRNSLGDDLDAQATAAGDRGNDSLAADLDALRRVMIADVTARGGSLAHLFAYTPPQVSPALVIAHTLYHDPSSTIDQAAEIVARNRIRHPGFVPAAPIEVLAATQVQGG